MFDLKYIGNYLKVTFKVPRLRDRGRTVWSASASRKNASSILKLYPPYCKVRGGMIMTIACLLVVSSVQAQTKTNKKPVPKKTTAQEVAISKDTIKVKNSLKILSHVGQQSVKLRWALMSPIGWKACNQYGFKVERYTLKRDSSWLPSPELTLLSPVYKAKPLAEWETLAKQDDYAAIMAQALYGEKMEVDMSDKNPLTNIVNETQDLQQRYTLSMLACDMSFEAAKMAAWGYEDMTVKKNEKYFYRIIPLAPVSKLQLDSAYLVVSMDEYKALPAPGKPDIVFSDSLATLGYNYFFLRDTYLGFHIERSLDGGKTYEQLTKTPVVAMNEKKGQESYQFFYSDKLKDNSTEYQYRIKGITSFSEIGPVSPAVKGKGISRVSAFPHITSALLTNKGQAELAWEFDASNESKISRFELNHSTRNEGPYKVMQTDIAPTTRKLTVKKLENSNYFSITAVGKNGDRKTSPIRFLQPVDSIPPAAPVIVAATIDSLGKVSLSWKANSEQDLLGYKVLRANNNKEEAHLLTDRVITGTSFQDTLDPSMINRRIYYSVMALDKHYNQSDLSLPKEVLRPDVTPPTSPLFKNYEITDKGVNLTWVRCEDEDVARHILLRKETTSNATWVTVAQFKDATTQYTDQTAEAGRSYWYAILAKDESGLESKPVQPLKLRLPGDPDKLKVTGFKAVPEGNTVWLQWQTDRTDIDHYDIYKAEEEEPLQLLNMPKGQLRSIKDNIKLNYRYQYMIRMVLKNGTVGAFTKVSF